MKEINLEQIIQSTIGIPIGSDKLTPMDYGECKRCMFEAIIQTTNYINEHAKIIDKKVLFDDPKEGDDAYMTIQTIDKQSILDTIKQVK